MIRYQAGAGLIESLISLVILSVGMLGLIAMQAFLIQENSDSRTRMEAGFFATSLLGNAAADAAHAGCFIVNSAATAPCTSVDARAQATQWINDVLAALPSAAALPPVVAYDATNGQMSVTLRWQPHGDTTIHNYVAISQVSAGL